MRHILARVQGWWRPARAGAIAPFEVACACGQVVTGQRQLRHQAVRCPACQKKVFVLPISPLPAPRSATWSGRSGLGQALAAGTARSPAPFGGWTFWRWPAAAAALTLTVATAGLLALLHFADQRQLPGLTQSADPRMLIAEGEQAIADGQFQTAAQRLRQGLALWEVGQAPPAREEKRLRLLIRQAELLGDLLTEPLGDVVHLAMVDEKQWPDQFARRYKGRGVVFDAEVRRDAAGQYRLNYHVQAGGQAIRVELGDLTMMEALPLQKPTRLLFGARLASVAREAGGVWAVRFEPGSGVLLTDERAVAASCPPPVDEELLQVLQRQAAWAAELP